MRYFILPVLHVCMYIYIYTNPLLIITILFISGTTNFMLCKMEDEGADYSAVLAEAQRLGYAEADPTADVEGHDVQAKIALLGTFGLEYLCYYYNCL